VVRGRARRSSGDGRDPPRGPRGQRHRLLGGQRGLPTPTAATTTMAAISTTAKVEASAFDADTGEGRGQGGHTVCVHLPHAARRPW
jgi:hypothetical protein